MTRSAQHKTLVLVRHAKAEQTFGKADHDRELTGRGRRDARVAGAWLRERNLLPELTICSTAIRARQTWDELAHGGCSAEFVEYRRELYAGGLGALLNAVRDDGSDMSSVLVVGHNPTIAEATSALADGAGSDRAHAALALGVPTTGIAVLSYAGSWQDLSVGEASLQCLHVARAEQDPPI